MGYSRVIVGLTGKRLLLATVCSVCLFAANASAEYIQFTFTGAVTDIVGATWDPWFIVNLGDEIKIQYTVDSNAEDQAPGSDIGRYDFLDFSFSLNNVALGTSDGYVDLEYDPHFQDLYELQFDFDDVSGFIRFFGTDMLLSDALPLDVDWTQYASYNFGVIGPSIGGGYIQYQFTSYEYAVVPAAPSCFVLLLGVHCRRRRH